MNNSVNNFKYILEGNWDELKGKIQTKWGDLTDQDLNKINGSYKKLKGKLEKLYGYTAEEVEDEIKDFFDTKDFEEIKKQTQNRIAEIKEVVTSTLDEYFQKAKEKTAAAEKAVVNYATEHPMKSLGVAIATAATSALIGYLCSSRRSD